MTYNNGRLGRRYNRAGMGDPRGSWAKGVPASAGFYPAQGVRFAGTGDPLKCDDRNTPHCVETESRVAKYGKSFSSTGLKLSRRGAPKTRLKHGMTKRRRFAATPLKRKPKGLRRKSRK
jgi:hypothetical protein